MADPVMVSVTSSNLEAVGYDAASETMYVRFRGGATWAYPGVDQATYDSVRSAESVGRAYNASIKGQYEGERQ